MKRTWETGDLELDARLVVLLERWNAAVAAYAIRTCVGGAWCRCFGGRKKHARRAPPEDEVSDEARALVSRVARELDDLLGEDRAVMVRANTAESRRRWRARHDARPRCLVCGTRLDRRARDSFCRRCSVRLDAARRRAAAERVGYSIVERSARTPWIVVPPRPNRWCSGPTDREERVLHVSIEPPHVAVLEKRAV